MGIQSYFELPAAQRLKALYAPVGIFFGLIAMLFLFKGSFSFAGGSDAMLLQNYGPDFVDALKADRKTFYSSDLLRSSFFVLVTVAILWWWSREKIVARTAIILIGIFMIADLFFIDKNYVSQSDFVSAHDVDVPFEMTEADRAILQDTTHYRVFETSQIHNARTSYFHKSISGYSAVRPRRMEELLEYQIAKNNLEILNLLNVKYVIQQNEKGEEFVIPNPEANGNAWFVDNLQIVSSADAEMKALNQLKSKRTAIVNQTQFPEAASKSTFTRDSTAASIKLLKYEPNRAVYESRNASQGFAVFSEMYYPKGWIATIDNKEVPIYRADYTLRALHVPAGNHKIEFRFQPAVIQTGGTVSFISSMIIILLAAGGFYYEYRKQPRIK
ncbi:MAG: hypothetical protein EOP49_44365, partial [Sphingobacteriales bacterium]